MDPIPVTVIGVVVTFWVERFLSSKWVGIYYRIGLPIYHKTAKIETCASLSNSSVISLGRKIELKRVSQFTCFLRVGRFKEVGAQVYELSPFRGVIHMRDQGQKCTVTAFLNWHVALLVALFCELIYNMPGG